MAKFTRSLDISKPITLQPAAKAISQANTPRGPRPTTRRLEPIDVDVLRNAWSAMDPSATVEAERRSQSFGTSEQSDSGTVFSVE